MFNQLRACSDQLLFTFPEADKAIPAVSGFGPESIGHAVRIDPRLCCFKERLLTTFLSENAYVVDKRYRHRTQNRRSSIAVFPERPVTENTVDSIVRVVQATVAVIKSALDGWDPL